MGLWGSFGSGFQRENLIPNIPTIPKTSPEAEYKAHSRDFRDSRYKVSILKNTSQEEASALSTAAGRDEEPAKAEPSIMPGEKGAQTGRERLKADVAAIHERFRRPPMLYADMPDWWAFCSGYPHCDEMGCPYLDAGKACWCRLWEACFPGVVRWYPCFKQE